MGHVFDEGLSLRKIQRGVEIMLWARHQESIFMELARICEGYIYSAWVVIREGCTVSQPASVYILIAFWEYSIGGV